MRCSRDVGIGHHANVVQFIDRELAIDLGFLGGEFKSVAAPKRLAQANGQRIVSAIGIDRILSQSKEQIPGVDRLPIQTGFTENQFVVFG